MGVRGLQKALRDFGKIVDLIEHAKLDKTPLTLLVDYYAFSFFISETFVSHDPEESLLLDVDPLRRYEFCELNKLRGIISIVIKLLRKNNIELEFIGDGSYKLGSEEGDTKHEEWKRRGEERWSTVRLVEMTFRSRNASAARSIYQTVSRNVSLPPTFSGQLQCSIREVGCSVWFSEGEADKLLAEISRRRSARSSHMLRELPRVFAIFSNDSDFSLMSGCRLMLANAFDPQRQLCKVVSQILNSNSRGLMDPCHQFVIDDSNPDHQLTSLNASLYSPEDVARGLRLNVDVLPEISILAGNDFTKDFKYKHRVPSFIPKAAETLRALQTRHGRSPRVEDIDGVRSLLILDPGFRRAVDFSRVFYGHDSTGQLNGDLEQRELEEYTKWRFGKGHLSIAEGIGMSEGLYLRRNCCLGTFPRFALQVIEGKTFWIQQKVEFVNDSEFGIEDGLCDLRRYLYAILGVPPTAYITEYGRVGRNIFSVVKRYPPAIPERLTWQGVLKTSQTDSEAVEKALAEIFTMVVQSTKPGFHFSPMTSNLSTIFLVILDSLKFVSKENRFRALLKHEVESVVVSMCLSVKSTSEDAKLNTFQSGVVNKFRVPESTFEDVVYELVGAGYDSRDDRLGLFTKSPGVIKSFKRRCPDLNGLVAGFRSLVVFSWIQILWLSILDVFSLYHGAVANERAELPFAFILNGDIFRWIYAAGAVDWDMNGRKETNEVEFACESIPIEVSDNAKEQFRFVGHARRLLLKQPAIQQIFQSMN